MSAAAEPTKPAAPLPVQSGYSSAALSFVPVWAAQEGGYFREQGLDVTLTRVGGGAPLLAAMNSGELDLAYSGAPALVLGYLEGLQTTIVGAMSNSLDSMVFVRPEVQTVDDLRGKSIGVSNLKGITDIAARLSLEHLGLRPDEDVFIRQTGGMGESLAALEMGTIAGVSLGVPSTFEAQKRGYRALVNTAELHIPFMGSSVGAPPRTVTERPAVAERTLRALAQATSRIKTDREFGIDVLVKYTQIDDRAVLGESLDYYRPLWLTDLYPDPKALQGVLDIEDNPAARTTRPEQIVDTRFAEQLRASGFLDQLPKE